MKECLKSYQDSNYIIGISATIPTHNIQNTFFLLLLLLNVEWMANRNNFRLMALLIDITTETKKITEFFRCQGICYWCSSIRIVLDFVFTKYNVDTYQKDWCPTVMIDRQSYRKYVQIYWVTLGSNWKITMG